MGVQNHKKWGRYKMNLYCFFFSWSEHGKYSHQSPLKEEEMTQAWCHLFPSLSLSLPLSPPLSHSQMCSKHFWVYYGSLDLRISLKCTNPSFPLHHDGLITNVMPLKPHALWPTNKYGFTIIASLVGNWGKGLLIVFWVIIITQVIFTAVWLILIFMSIMSYHLNNIDYLEKD